MMTGSITSTLTTGGSIVAYQRLSLAEREMIMCQLATHPNRSWTKIGSVVGRHRSTIQREVARNGGRSSYRAHRAHTRAREQASRPRYRFDLDPQLAVRVRHLLIMGYSPYAVAHLTKTVCAETIYQGIYSGRLNMDPEQVLRTRRPRRRHRHLRQPTSDGNYLGAFTPITQRPDIINQRHRIGDWEGDLITGTKNQSAIITLVERHTRYLVALNLPNGHSADATITRLRAWLTTHPKPVYSITWDRGAELTRWTQLRDHHHIAVYFCDPKSPWQRGTAEHTNRQLRYWFPRRTNLSIYTQHDLNHACWILNTTPRRLHNGATPHHLYHHQPRTKE